MTDEIKKQLREEADKIAASLSEEYVAESNEWIFKNLLQLPQFQKAKCVFAYYSVGNEPDTDKIIKAVLSSGKKLALPRIVGNGIMHAVSVNSENELVPGKFNIPAPPESAPIVPPDEIDLVIVPAVLFDEDGYRLGRGGGYYDRYLSGFSGFSVGIARETMMRDGLPRGEYDIPVSVVITENGARPR